MSAKPPAGSSANSPGFASVSDRFRRSGAPRLRRREDVCVPQRFAHEPPRPPGTTCAISRPFPTPHSPFPLLRSFARKARSYGSAEGGVDAGQGVAAGAAVGGAEAVEGGGVGVEVAVQGIGRGWGRERVGQYGVL